MKDILAFIIWLCFVAALIAGLTHMHDESRYCLNSGGTYMRQTITYTCVWVK